MKTKSLISLILAIIMIFSGIPVIAAPDAVKTNPDQAYIGKPAIIRNKNQAKDNMYYENAYDSFSMEYTPLDSQNKTVKVCDIFIFNKMKWQKIYEDKSYSKNYTVFYTTDNFVFVILRNKTNPYIEKTQDYKNFESLSGQADKLLLSYGLREIKAAYTKINGKEINYYFSLPSMPGVSAIKTISEKYALQKEEFDFMYVGDYEVKIANLKIYLKSDFETLKNKEDIGKVVLDFMNCIFVLQQNPNPFTPGTPNYQNFEIAANKIPTAISEAYIYDARYIDTSFKTFENQVYTELKVGGKTVSYTVLFDSIGRPLFPLEPLAEALGYKLLWNERSSTFTLIKGNSLIASKSINNKYTMVDYKTAGKLSTVLIDNTVYVGIDFVINSLNCALNMDADGNILIQSMK